MAEDAQDDRHEGEPDDPGAAPPESAAESPSRDAGGTGPWYDDLAVTDGKPITIDWPPSAKHRRSAARSAVEWTLVIVGALALALLIRTFAIQTFRIPSESMQSTLLVRDRVLVNKLAYKAHAIHRGDVVVFERPPKETNTTIKDLIKRVIALPGETVEGRDGKVLVDGRLLTEPYLDDGKTTSDFGPVTVPEGNVWVMGDNRDHSLDSRFFGPIETRTVVGRAFLRIYPFGRLGWL